MPYTFINKELGDEILHVKKRGEGMTKSDYYKIIEELDRIIGYFQFKSETSDIAEKGIKKLFLIQGLIKKYKQKIKESS